MLDRHAYKVAVLIQVDVDVFTNLASLYDLPVVELEEGCIAVLEIFDLHVLLYTKVLVEKRIVYCFAVCQCNHAEELLCFLDPSPSTEPAVCLYLRRRWSL